MKTFLKNLKNLSVSQVLVGALLVLSSSLVTRWWFAKQYFGAYAAGIAAMGAQNTNKAIQDFSRALRVNPADAISEFGMGWALQKQGRLTEAKRYYSSAGQNLKSIYGFVEFNSGVLAQAERRAIDAVAHYRRAAVINGTGTAASRNLISALSEAAFEYASKGNKTQAQDSMNEALKLSNNDPTLVERSKKLSALLSSKK